MVNVTDSTMRLFDGRRLGFAQYGDPEGSPVFFFHGMPGSRLDRHPDEGIARSLRARIITVDRPGYGLSSPHRSGGLLDWPGDIAQLADSLGIERLAIAAWSGGAPYALACAYTMPRRVTRVGIMSGLAPFDAPGTLETLDPTYRLWIQVDRALPLAALEPLYHGLATSMRLAPDLTFNRMVASFSAPERAVATRPAIRRLLMEGAREALRQGGAGYARDSFLFSRPWGFRLEDIEIDVFIWYGDQDTLTPAPMGDALAAAIPHSHPTFYPNEGHMLWYDHWPEILSTLVE